MSIQRRQYEKKSNDELIALFKATGSLEVKQELVMRYLYIVETAARRMKDVYLSFAQIEDVINEGVIVLMNSLERYDPEKNVKFDSYVYKRIRGMIIDMAREQDWIPRSLRKKIKDMRNCEDELAGKLGRKPEEKEIAEELGIDLKEVEELYAKDVLAGILSLDAVIESANDGTGSYHPADINAEVPGNRLMVEELHKELTEAIKTLNNKEQLVLSLYYKEELNMVTIADIMNISKPRVSQIHSAAVKKLKMYLKKRM